MPKGRHPKPAHLRQNRTKKAGIATIEASDHPNIPPIPNPDQRTWHALTLKSWVHAWASPMATQWLETDVDALGRLALLWDAFYQNPVSTLLAEIRLQESRFGLSPLDRSRLQWEVFRAEEAGHKRPTPPKKSGTGGDPRRFLSMVR